jgi:urease subunit alpha
MFAAYGKALPQSWPTFVSKIAVEERVVERYGLERPVVLVMGCRGIGKKDLPHNDATPEIKVDPDRYSVWADGELLTCEPANVLPPAQRYCLFKGTKDAQDITVGHYRADYRSFAGWRCRLLDTLGRGFG